MILWQKVCCIHHIYAYEAHDSCTPVPLKLPSPQGRSHFPSLDISPFPFFLISTFNVIYNCIHICITKRIDRTLIGSSYSICASCGENILNFECSRRNQYFHLIFHGVRLVYRELIINNNDLLLLQRPQFDTRCGEIVF